MLGKFMPIGGCLLTILEIECVSRTFEFDKEVVLVSLGERGSDNDGKSPIKCNICHFSWVPLE